MNMRLNGFGGLPHVTATKNQIITVSTVVGAVAVTIFVMTEIVAAVFVTVWALSGFFHLGTSVTIVFMSIVALPLVWIGYIVAKFAFNAETDPDNQ